MIGITLTVTGIAAMLLAVGCARKNLGPIMTGDDAAFGDVPAIPAELIPVFHEGEYQP